MPLRFFSIPVHHGEDAANELNAFLGSHRVAGLQRELVHDGVNSFWAVCVSYVVGEAAKLSGSKKPRIDYREVLSEGDFAVYAKLRSLRKELSDRADVPAYALFTNEQLAAMVTQRVSSVAALQAIDGVGPSRIEKYGEAFLKVLKAEAGDAKESDETHSDQS